MIRKAKIEDISRIAEILVFVKRIKFRPIFQNDDYSFGELQVIPVAKKYSEPSILEHIWVYDDGIVKGLVHIVDKEVKKLYVDYFFESQGIGGKLLDYAVDKFDVEFLWAIEKNIRAVVFYERHGFCYKGEWEYEEGTTERLIKLERN